MAVHYTLEVKAKAAIAAMSYGQTGVAKLAGISNSTIHYWFKKIKPYIKKGISYTELCEILTREQVFVRKTKYEQRRMKGSCISSKLNYLCDMKGKPIPEKMLESQEKVVKAYEKSKPTKVKKKAGRPKKK